MNKNDLKALIDKELITDVNLVDDLLNSDDLSTVSVDQLTSMGVLSNVVVNTHLKEHGINALTPILTQADLVERLKQNGTVKLTNDIQLDNCLIIDESMDVTIDLNGYNITSGVFTESAGVIKEGNNDSFVFWNTGGKLTIKGAGKIQAQDAKYSIAVWANAGEVNIYGGDFYNGGVGCDLIYASGTGAVNIYGGYYEATLKGDADGTANKRSALNLKDRDKKTASIKVMGGSFYEFNPADNVSESPAMSFVAEGHTVEVDGLIYKVV
jgi:hypothetical protein